MGVCSQFVWAVAIHLFGSDLSAADPIVDHWKQSAASVTSLRLKFRGRDTHATQELVRTGKRKSAEGSEVTLRFEIDYSFARNAGERISRRGQLLRPANARPGLGEFIEHREVRSTNSVQSCLLVEGGEQAEFEYDQFTLQPPRPIREPVLQPIRNLLNLSYLGTGTFYGTHVFQAAALEPANVQGVTCAAVESSAENGIRIWYESAKPSRIRKLELGYLASDRFGHVECLFSYESSAVEGAFEIPSGWNIFIFTPSGECRSRMECEVTEAYCNPAIPAEELQLNAPAGAIVTDDRESPPRYGLQLADGSMRTLMDSEMTPHHLFDLSASVRGSRIEGRRANDWGNDAEARRTRFVWTINVIALIVLAVLYVRRRSQLGSRIP